MQECLVRIEGRVQGVGYRAFAQREAISLRLTGFARNLRDGRVEVLVQGEKSAVEAFISRLQEGPRLAAVLDVVVVERALGTEYVSFEVR